MAQIDTSIPMGFRPIQIESPVNQMAALSQLQSAQQQQQMNALKMQEYQQQVQDRNELARIMGDPNLEYGSDAFMQQVLKRVPSQYETIATRVAQREDLKERTAKREYETEKLKAEVKQRQLEEFRTARKDIAAFESIEDIKADLDRRVGSGLLPVDMAANILAGLPTDNAKLPAWKKQTLMSLVTAEKQLEFVMPKVEKVDVGGAIRFIDVNPNSPTYNQEVGPKSITKTPAPVAPSKVVQLQTELDTAVKTYGVNSPQAKQIRDEIEQETGGLERKRIEIDRYRSRKGEGGGIGDGGPPTKLEKGERWNAEENRIETVPGSKLHVAQSDKHNKDREALKGVETKTQSAISKIDELLSPKYLEGFRANFSGDVPYSGVVTQYFAPDARRRIDSLKSDMKAAGLELIRVGGSIGAMTQQEWPIVEQMIAALTPDMTAQEAETQVKKIRAYMQRIQNNAKDAYQTEWGDTQYFKPTEKPRGGGLSPADKQALDWANANPKDPRSAQIKQRLGVR